MAMRDHGLNDFALAHRIGVTHPVIGNYKAGQLPKSEQLALLADVFGVSMDWLMGRETTTGGLILQERPAQHLVDDVIAEAEEIRLRTIALVKMAAKLKGSK